MAFGSSLHCADVTIQFFKTPLSFWSPEPDPAASVSIYLDLLLGNLHMFFSSLHKLFISHPLPCCFVLFFNKLPLYLRYPNFSQPQITGRLFQSVIGYPLPFWDLSCHITTSNSHPSVQIPNQSHLVMFGTSEWFLLIYQSATYLHHVSKHLGK